MRLPHTILVLALIASPLAQAAEPAAAITRKIEGMIAGLSAYDDNSVAQRREALELAQKSLAKTPGLDAVETEGIEWIADAEDLKLPATPRGLLQVTAAAYCSLIPSLGVLSQPGAARKCGKLLAISVDYDPAYDHGAPLRGYARFLYEAPGIVGGDNGLAVKFAKRAAELEPRYALNLLTLANAQKANGEARSVWEVPLKALLLLPDDAIAERVDKQVWAKSEARKLLETP